jgi:hypothetical protein
MWYNLAVEHSTGDPQKFSANNRDRVARLMTPAQIAEAQRLAQQCHAQQFKGCQVKFIALSTAMLQPRRRCFKKVLLS